MDSMIDAIDHINIVVRDLERSARFYVELLGLEETRRAHLEGAWIEQIVGLKEVQAEVVYVQPRGGGPRIELIHYHAPAGVALPECAQPNTIGLRHVAFRVEKMDEIYRRLLEAGVEFVGPPVKVPGGVVQHDAGDKRLCYFHDPDGVILELAEYV